MAAGAATLVASFGFGWIPNLVACGPTHGAGAITAFELARSTADIAELFGREPCTSRFAEAQARGLWLDMLGFIPAYAAFLGCGAWALAGGGRRMGWAALAAVVAALLDEAEGVTMFAILGSLPGKPWLFDALFWTVRPKFFLLGVAEVLMAVSMLRHGWLGRIAAVPMGLGGLAGIAVILFAPHSPWLIKTHNYAWIALLALALVAAVKPVWVARRVA
ncbi:hypothetical protein [Sphingomonas sp.]|uniref:hypothetical protein n=1 Tax=Sphingomonas sp. TaxID=28214 RepID=UPI001B28C767|nr:hypothetical protein [Sphingomonas sp.]MBO9713070.1 hypothetical protein [Sphingomonas sp.]